MNCLFRPVAAAVLLSGACAGGAIAQQPVPLDALKAAYLACDRDASRRRLDVGEAALCSTVAEQLLQSGFGGDFERLLAWWRSAKLEAADGEVARR
jgi:hypothetical protein